MMLFSYVIGFRHFQTATFTMTNPARQQQRKDGTRRKIIAGAAALDYAQGMRGLRRS